MQTVYPINDVDWDEFEPPIWSVIDEEGPTVTSGIQGHLLNTPLFICTLDSFDTPNNYNDVKLEYRVGMGERGGDGPAVGFTVTLQDDNGQLVMSDSGSIPDPYPSANGFVEKSVSLTSAEAQNLSETGSRVKFEHDANTESNTLVEYIRLILPDPGFDHIDLDGVGFKISGPGQGQNVKLSGPGFVSRTSVEEAGSLIDLGGWLAAGSGI